MSSSSFAEFHAELRDVARKLLAPGSPLTTGGRQPEPFEWAQLESAGWLGLEVPESDGGAGATFAESGVILRELGRAAASVPYLGSVVLGVGALNLLESVPQVRDLRRRVACGQTRIAVAWPGDATVTPTAPFRLSGVGGRAYLDGETGFVPDVAEADRLLIPAVDEDGVTTMVELEPAVAGLRMEAQTVVDQTRRLGTVRAEHVEVELGSIWAFGSDPAPSMRALDDRAALATACDSLGITEALLEATVSYAASRHQFGRPIGSFQAVKHACADMHVQLRVSQALVAAAETAMVEGDPDAWVAVSMAKSHVCEAAVGVAGKAMQLHGGVGYTWERGIHAYLKRTLLNRALFGSSSMHRKRIATRYPA